MKMSPERYAEIKEGIRLYLEHGGVGREGVLEYMKRYSTMGIMWKLYCRYWDSKTFDDDNVLFKYGMEIRVAAYDPCWDEYEGVMTNDDIAVALEQIGRELDLIF